MKIGAYYSHLNGLEWLLHHYSKYWDEINNALNSVNAEDCRNKVSEEKTMKGRLLYAPKDMNKAIKKALYSYGWSNPKRYDFLLTDNSKLTAEMINQRMSIDQQKQFMDGKGEKYYQGFTEADFFKDRVSIEVQFGKYSFVQYDMFVKHAADYMHDRIDLGIEIVPMKSLEKEMSSGPSNYERNLHEILRQGRIFPPVPLILIGIIP